MNNFYEQNELENALCAMDSFDAISHCLNLDENGNDIVLHPIQCIDVMKMLARKRSMVVYDTGCGKTYIAAAVMRLLKNENPKRKFIMFVKKDQLTQTPSKLERATGMTVIASAANAQSRAQLYSSNFRKYDILMLTHDCLHNKQMLEHLFELRGEYCGMIIDEAHELNNFVSADSAHLLSAITKQFEYCYALTATPITTAIDQLVRLAAMIDAEHFGNITKFRTRLRRDPSILQDMGSIFIVRGRADFGGKQDYRGRVHWVTPMAHQMVPCSSNIFMQFKGEGAFKQLKALLDEIERYKGKRGLIYINQHKIREWVLPYLVQNGVRVACINGYTKAAERKQIMEAFNRDRSLDVIITSVTTAVDLDCDYVIFYEFTTNVKQMIGRAHRGLGDKVLDIVYIITEDSEEVDFFMDNIWARCELTRNVLGQSCAGLDGVRDSVEGRYA